MSKLEKKEIKVIKIRIQINPIFKRIDVTYISWTLKDAIYVNLVLKDDIFVSLTWYFYNYFCEIIIMAVKVI